MIIKKKINKEESLIYLKKVNKFLVVGKENLKLIDKKISSERLEKIQRLLSENQTEINKSLESGLRIRNHGVRNKEKTCCCSNYGYRSTRCRGR